MNSTLVKKVEHDLSQVSERAIRIVKNQPVSGGCINRTWNLETNCGTRYFVKHNPKAPYGMFRAEAAGLRELAAPGHIRVPNVISESVEPNQDYLILESVESGPKARDFFEQFGRRLANLHRATASSHFGWTQDNFIGATPQPNQRGENWIEFWREQRLVFQLDLARQNGYSNELQVLGSRLIDRLENWIGNVQQEPVLLHGDLWSGNYLADEYGTPVLIDPAVYFGHHEAEFGMISLFGGVNESFYRAYEEVLPLEPGHEERIAIYRLYHLLNHLNLFGASYLENCVDLLRRLV